MRSIILLFFVAISSNTYSQKDNEKVKEDLLTEVSKSACQCVDSIDVYDKPVTEISKEIRACIDKQVLIYQLGAQLIGVTGDISSDKKKKKKKDVSVSLNQDPSSSEYKDYYFEIERHMMQNCPSLKTKAAINDKQHSKSYSKNQEALDLFSQGVQETKNGNLAESARLYEAALKIDPEFSFCWDNLGITYRKLGEYDRAIAAYEKSLEVDPQGTMPLQNLGSVYEHQKQYEKAINAYERLAKVDKDNPEVYYGIGRVSAVFLNDYEKGLDNMCKAYKIYVQQGSPYRTDAENVIQQIYSEMKKLGKEDKFYEILKANNISGK